MGLDTSHDCWHGSYGGFKVFREACAAAAQAVFGYEPDYTVHPYRSYDGYWDYHGLASRYLPDSELLQGYHPYTHILDVFFVHSDCDGYIFPHDARDLIPALEQLGPHIDPDWRERLDQFIAGLRVAAEEWEIVVYH